MNAMDAGPRHHEDRGVTDGVVRWDDDGEAHEWPSVAAWAEQWWAERRAGVAAQDRPVDPAGSTPATDYLEQLTYDRTRSRDLVDLVVALSELAATEEDRSYLGAGDIESVLVHEGGADLLDHVELRARQNPRFAEVLTYVWVGDGVGEPMRSRLLALGAIDLSGPLPR
jgi:hypothetical protein